MKQSTTLKNVPPELNKRELIWLPDATTRANEGYRENAIFKTLPSQPY